MRPAHLAERDGHFASPDRSRQFFKHGLETGQAKLISMIEKKLLRIQQRPEQIFVAVAFGALGIKRLAGSVDAGFEEVGFGDLDFVGGGFAGEGGEVEFADAFGLGHLGFGELFGAAAAGGELGFDVARIHEVQALGEACGGDAFAFADAGVVGSAEDFEEG